MKRLIMAAVVMVAIAGQAWGDFSIKEFIRLSNGSKSEQYSTEMFIGGVGKGYLWANTSLGQRGQKELFCYAGDYTTKQLYDLAKQHAKYIRGIDPKENDIPMELVLLMKLQQLHPCK